MIWTFNTLLASTTTNSYTSLSSQSTVSQIPTTTIAAPGKSFYGGYFSLTYSSSDSNYAYYQLYYTFVLSNNSFLNQTQCVSNSSSLPNQIQLFNTSDFAVNCQSGCISNTNSSLLGYMNGLCESSSTYMNWALITSSYQVLGELGAQNFIILQAPQNLNYINWYQLNHYFGNLGGYIFNLNNSMVPRSDTNLLNNPPVVIFPPITTIQLQNSYLEIFYIPVMDQDEDTIQCNSIRLNLIFLNMFFY